MSPKGVRALRRILAIILLSALILVLAVYNAGEIYRSVDYRDDFIERRGELALSEERLIGEEDGHMLFEVELESSTGIRTGGILKAPAGGGLHPAFLILGGLRTGRKTIGYIGATRDIVILALDYPYEGRKEGMGTWEFIRAVPRIRRAILDTPPAVMTAVDYLIERDGVDPGRIIVIGGSLGSFFVPAHAAIDDRTAAAVLIYGAGDIESLLRESGELPGLLARPAAWIGAVLVSPIEPLRYISEISPRPLLMISGARDPRIPERFSRLLHEAAGEPKTIKWIDAGHVAVQEEQFRRLIGEALIEWLVDQRLVAEECFTEYSD
jgi:hypothetical protein